ncbi:hypothetical protein [Vibrio sp. SCSIO 43136]|uniref:hypothetical protein n=1 Tax=Vibrio sp. SCSIO 43136 TaxID=2819101 RepID=UPI002075F1D2|nr:hypothetical protein [Vibrio sp. SCSIO 43136]USD68114.1 hypothetical protein J4N39_18235 [Vibrio sp. SCSIO 43136]
MIEAKERYVSSVLVKRYIEENSAVPLKDMTGVDAVEFVFGSREDDYCSEFKIVNTRWKPEQRWWHRLNMFWAYPLTLICAPYQYVKSGETGWSDETKFGRFMLKACGFR